MPPKAKKKKAEETSKKAVQKKKEKLLEDKTFGLKNKNKSAKVQSYVNSQKANIMNTGTTALTRKQEEEKKQQKLAKKALMKAKKAEQDALFGEALLAVSKKGGNKFDGKSGKIESKGRDHDDGKEKGGTSRAMKMMFQMDAKEMEERLKEDPNYVPTLEDKIEAERQKKLAELKASGKTGTPVTEASFKEWQERKRKRKEAESKKKVEVEMKKKKGGKGLSVLSGRELYNYKKDLFKDQDDGDEAVSENGQVKGVEAVAEKVEKDFFLGDDDLDDLDDDDD